MKVWELEEGEEYMSGGDKYKRHDSELFYWDGHCWEESSIKIFIILKRDFTKIEKTKHKTEIVFLEYFNTNSGELFWMEKTDAPNGITSFQKPTGETLTREIEL